MYTESIMKIYAQRTFGTTLAKLGIERRVIAEEAGVSISTVNNLCNPQAHGRDGSTREITAWKVARAFARLMNKTPEEAFEDLFVEGD